MGTQFHQVPDSGDVPLIADMSSDILWRPIDVSKFGLIYAGAQKNLGPSGITILILRRDLADRSPNTIPKIFRYKTILDGDSLQNTIPTFPVYMVRNVLRWLRDQGGAAAMEQRNRDKAGYIYDMIDTNPGFFHCPVEVGSRSMMNLVFRLPTEDLEKKFVADAADAGMVGLKGHRSVGGIRASIYNAMEPADVQKFVDFAKTFAKNNA
jgi:phosphoserine aminotransferase